jgi:SAM-dependent methyltransferase
MPVRNALAWTKRRGLLALDLGAAHRKPPGYLGVDQYARDGVDIIATLPAPLDLPDDSVGLLRAVDFLEHVPAKVPLINELYRLMAPGGMLLTLTPSSDGRGAYQDPTHVAYYNENSFFPTDWHSRNQISYVQANLIAVKDGAERCGGPCWCDAPGRPRCVQGGSPFGSSDRRATAGSTRTTPQRARHLWMRTLRLLEMEPYADKTDGPPRQHGHTVRTGVRADTE